MRDSRERWAELALHPVRIRVLRVVGGGRRSTREIAGRLPDVPQATLYRHLAALAKGGLLEVVEERRVGGTNERVYALPPGGAVLSGEALATATAEDHGRYFTAFVSSLLAEFSRYLAREQIDLAADGVGYQQSVLHLDDEEFADFARGFTELVRPLLGNEPREGRTARLLATVLMPVDPPSTQKGGEPSPTERT
ncbi:helix-turn-helix domain-containing protein [Actinomadura luteofluorescens]|uniref:DNA-binding transcriptional ArsR family regulator n=1 Tax=Actinomadura luteofluorescens TaxID=46163 RepID=A0A7Y9JK67_9ACTN|nr:helix-turn-helix domain-containing protein [Actinomadura luteofluorescens]NYD52000.1 DNA-binding transcriptional ArsR family regulator [Actinomadura luteofluorescens]